MSDCTYFPIDHVIIWYIPFWYRSVDKTCIWVLLRLSHGNHLLITSRVLNNRRPFRCLVDHSQASHVWIYVNQPVKNSSNVQTYTSLIYSETSTITYVFHISNIPDGFPLKYMWCIWSEILCVQALMCLQVLWSFGIEKLKQRHFFPTALQFMFFSVS